jgi:hypothetical protein
VLALRREADVRHHRDAGPHDGLDRRRHAAPALELHRVRQALLHHPDRRRERLPRRLLVAAERQVRDDERAFRRPRDGAYQRQHLVDGHRQRRGVPEDVVGR